MNQLIWFRQDLRIHDQSALWFATQAGPTCAIVYLSIEQWKVHHDAPIKIDFYLRQLKTLKKTLESLNIPLIIRKIPYWCDIAEDLLLVSQQQKIGALHANIECGVNELKRDAQVQALLEKYQIQVELYQDRTLFPVGSIRNKTGHPYQVFGAFKKFCYELLNINIPSCFPKIHPQFESPKITVESIDTSSITDFFPNFSIQTDIWPVGEAHAHSLLNNFIEDRLTDYQNTRDYPSLDGTSQLSAYLNIGILSIRQCIQALFESTQGYFQISHLGQQTWLDELIWREFYQHILFDYPHVSKHQPFKTHTKNIPWADHPEHLQAWQQGRTGIPIVDAGMRQMLSTGWMHNRVRMIVAMFLCKNLLIDWRLGEQWFMQHLIDGDLAANNGGWQWCASTGTDAAPYFRIFNPISQSIKFDETGNYIRQWVPELAHLDDKQIHEPYAKAVIPNLNYPHPLVDLKSSRQYAITVFKQYM